MRIGFRLYAMRGRWRLNYLDDGSFLAALTARLAGSGKGIR